ncbi:MAG: 2-dehydropantoate 2-reductase [Myxococcota bacterium]|jgi:2-dehydropantoate 2-reductase
MESTPSRVLVVGVGSIGGTISGHLSTLGRGLAEVTGLTSNHEIAAAIAERGYRLRTLSGDQSAPGRVVTALTEDEPPFNFIFLATQPPQVEQAARDALPWLAADGRMVVLQNGLCEDRIARIAGAERVLGAVVGWGASTIEPGFFERTSEGGFTLGRMDSAADPALSQLALLLEHVAPVDVSDNLAGARWSKLAINCAISTLGTIGGDTLGRLMPFLVVRRLALHLMTEVVEVAHAEGVALEKLSGTMDLDWLALSESERGNMLGAPALVAKHSLLVAVGMRYRRLRSSMLHAIERGRPPAVDFLNGEIVTRGEAHGIATPANRLAQEAVHAIARGERPHGLRTLRKLAHTLGINVAGFTGYGLRGPDA